LRFSTDLDFSKSNPESRIVTFACAMDGIFKRKKDAGCGGTIFNPSTLEEEAGG
jgi:hypothetical protein